MLLYLIIGLSLLLVIAGVIAGATYGYSIMRRKAIFIALPSITFMSLIDFIIWNVINSEIANIIIPMVSSFSYSISLSLVYFSRTTVRFASKSNRTLNILQSPKDIEAIIGPFSNRKIYSFIGKEVTLKRKLLLKIIIELAARGYQCAVISPNIKQVMEDTMKLGRREGIQEEIKFIEINEGDLKQPSSVSIKLYKIIKECSVEKVLFFSDSLFGERDLKVIINALKMLDISLFLSVDNPSNVIYDLSDSVFKLNNGDLIIEKSSVLRNYNKLSINEMDNDIIVKA
jgi:hypothetical protein